MTTCNDTLITEMLIRIAQLQQVVSAHVRAGELGMALTKGSELEDVARKLNWRIHDVGYKPKGSP